MDATEIILDCHICKHGRAHTGIRCNLNCTDWNYLYEPVKEVNNTDATGIIPDGDWEDLYDEPKDGSAAYSTHYLGDVQPIQLMQATMSQEAFCGFLRGNIIKYASRLGKKDAEHKESAKILQYAMWLDEAINDQKVTL